MDKKYFRISVIAIIALIVIVSISIGLLQNNSNQNPSQIGIGSKEAFSVDINGGHHSAFDDAVEIDIQAGSVSEQVNITVESIINPIEDTTLHMLSLPLELGPNGLIFEKPIESIYSLSTLIINGADGIKESDVKIYLL